MTRVLRLCAAVGFALLVVLAPSSASWAGEVSDQAPGFAFTTMPQEQMQTQTFSISRPASVPGDLYFQRVGFCMNPDGTAPTQVNREVLLVGSWAATSPMSSALSCPAGKVWAAHWYSIISERGESTFLRWQSSTWVARGSYNATTTNNTVTVSPSPSPSPSPVYTVAADYLRTTSAYPTGWPTPGAGGGGSVDSCAAATCTVELAPGSLVALEQGQAFGLWLFLGALLMLAVFTLVTRYGRAFRG